MAPPHEVTHVIFDVDGLLLDTESLYTDIMHSICSPHGKQFTFEIKMKQMGKKQRDAGKVLIDELELPISVDDYCRMVDELQAKLFSNAKLLPGAEKLVRHLHKHKVPMALATGSHKEEMKLKVSKHLELFGVFQHTVCSTGDPDVKKGKPAPDCFLVAANRFQDPPASYDKCLVFEDAINGVEGALAANMQVVWIPHSFMDTSQLENKVSVMLHSLEEFKPELFGLPPYE